MVFTFAVSVQGNLGTDGDRVGEGVRVTGWFWFTYLFLDTFSFEMVFCSMLGEILRVHSVNSNSSTADLRCQQQHQQTNPTTPTNHGFRTIVGF